MYSNSFKDREFLYQQFMVLKKSPRQIADMCGVSRNLIMIWLAHYRFLDKFWKNFYFSIWQKSEYFLNMYDTCFDLKSQEKIVWMHPCHLRYKFVTKNFAKTLDKLSNVWLDIYR